MLLIIGGGDVLPILEKMVLDLNLSQRVKIMGKLSPNELANYTAVADIGLSLDKDTNINYKYSLPNKLFDYIQARTPVLVSPLVELKRIVRQYHIGQVIESHEPKHIAYKIQVMLSDKNQLEKWKENLNIAAKELCWENEQPKLKSILSKYA